MTYESPPADDVRIDAGALVGAVVRRLPRILLVTLALLVATFVVLMFSPRLYESSASILVEPRTNAYVRASNDQQPTQAPNDASVMSSQIELLKSRDTLLKVIDTLDLRSNPEFNGSRGGFSPLGMIMQLVSRRASTPNSIDETVLNNLYERMTVVQERDSRIMSVLVRTTDPQLSADIANAVANAHVARRAQLSLSDTAEASGWLADEIARLRGSVQQAEGAVADFKVDNDLFTGQNNTSLLDQQLSTIAGQITSAQERKNTAQSRAQLIRGLIERGQSIEGVADVQDSVVIQRLSQEKATLQGELAQRSATLLSSHPTIRALNAQLAELESQIRAEGRRVADALDSEAQIESDLEASLQADLARAKASASTATRDTVTLDGLQREAKAQRDLLEAYLLRYNEASSRVDVNSALPDVRVISVAAPSVSPASPKTSLIMMAVGLVSLVVQIGLVTFGELMSGRALSPVAQPLRAQDELDELPFDGVDPTAENVVAEAPEVDLSEEVPLAPATRFADDDFGDDDPDLDLVGEPVQVAEVEAPAPDVSAARQFIRELMLAKPAAESVDLPNGDLVEIEDADTVDPVVDVEPALETVTLVDAEPEAVEPDPELTELASEPVPMPQRATSSESRSRLLRNADLVSDLVLGRTHLLLLADLGKSQDSVVMAEDLVGEALAKGLSVALVDAGSGRRSDAAGLTDLSTGLATFGDVVQKSADNSFAEVVWGRGTAIDRASPRPTTLVEALGDIYEVVVVLTGPVGRQTMLGNFAELGGRIVLVTSDDEGQLDEAETARRRLEEAGLPRVEIATFAQSVAA